ENLGLQTERVKDPLKLQDHRDRGVPDRVRESLRHRSLEHLDPVRRALADRLRGLISGTGKAGHLLTSAVQIQREQGLTQIFRLSAEERDGRLRSLDGIFDTAKPVERELKSPGGR